MIRQHWIGYARPGSANARALGRGEEGAWHLTLGDHFSGHATLEEAHAAAKALGSEPAQGSADYHWHSKYAGVNAVLAGVQA